MADLSRRDCRVSVVGSSFIRRLRDDQNFSDDFDLKNVRVNYVCRGGWRLQDARDSLPRISAQHPDIVILQIGSNDLQRARSPTSLADEVIDLAVLIHMHTQAFVVVCESLMRRRGRYLRSDRDVETYMSNVHAFNVQLPLSAHGVIGVKFWRHRGMRFPDESMYGPMLSADGVHLSSRGQYKFYKSIRGAINFARKRLHTHA